MTIKNLDKTPEVLLTCVEEGHFKNYMLPNFFIENPNHDLMKDFFSKLEEFKKVISTDEYIFDGENIIDDEIMLSDFVLSITELLEKISSRIDRKRQYDIDFPRASNKDISPFEAERIQEANPPIIIFMTNIDVLMNYIKANEATVDAIARLKLSSQEPSTSYCKDILYGFMNKVMKLNGYGVSVVYINPIESLTGEDSYRMNLKAPILLANKTCETHFILACFGSPLDIPPPRLMLV